MHTQAPQTQEQPAQENGKKVRKQRSDKGVKRGPRKSKVDNAVGTGD